MHGVVVAAAGLAGWPISTVANTIAHTRSLGRDAPRTLDLIRSQRNLSDHITRVAVPALSSLVCGLIAARMASPWAAPAFCVFAGTLVSLSAVDAVELRLPKRLVFACFAAGGALLAVASAETRMWGALLRAVVISLAAFGVFLGLHLASPRGLGYGDTRMGAMCGFFLGWLGVRYAVLGMFVAIVAAGAFSAIGLLAGVVRRDSHIPFGPFIAFGAVAGVLLA